MVEKEMQAHDMVRRRSWSRAVALYDQILMQLATGQGTGVVPTRSQKDRQIACLLGRCECLLELAKYDICLADARKVLTLLAEQSDCVASVSRTRRWLIHSLCKLKKYTEAEQTTREWITEISGQQNFADISKTLERYKSIIQMVNGYKTNQKISMSRLEDEMSILDTKLDHWATNNLPLDKYSKLLSNKGLKKRENNNQSQSHNGTVTAMTTTPMTNNNNSSNSSTASSSSNVNGGTPNTVIQKTTDLLAALKLAGKNDASGVTCSYCAISYQSRNELRQHCQTESHQNVIMSDEGRDWKWRPPPRGFTLDLYSLCESFLESQSCHYGNQCVEAHGLDELNEWKERFDYRKMRLQKACEKELYGKSYTEEILEKWIQATNPDHIMCEKVEGIDDQCTNELVTSISSKTSKREWLFVLKSKKSLRAIALLQDAHRNHFAIKSIVPGNVMGIGINVDAIPIPAVELKSDQEWVSAQVDPNHHIKSADDANSETVDPVLEHKIAIEFHTDIYGTFRQSVCIDFGSEPLLVKHLCVDVLPVGDAEKIEEIKKDIINSSSQRWDNSNTQLVKFETTIGTHLKTDAYLNDLKHEKEMLERYPCPRADTFTLTQSTIVEKRLTKNNYRSRIHELLYVEEIARYEQIARYNLRTKLTVTSNYILTPAGMATSTAKYSLLGELFALMRLGKDISEDTSAGRLILSNCSSVYISKPSTATATVGTGGGANDNFPSADQEKKRNIYEAVIEDKGKNVIYLKLSAKCVEAMALHADTEVEVDIQFQLNRLPYCEWHNAVDKITDFKIIFPSVEIEPSIPWTPKKQWSNSSELKLNAKQREAVNAITTSLNIKLPPILLIGPFGTGKTFTLAQAIKQLLTQPAAKILICTHSNSAADLYIKEYLHPWIEEGLEEATPLRVYYHKRWVATVNSVVQKYCITDGAGNFRRPTIEDILKHRIVVVTLSISMELSTLGLPKGYFTHVFLDEAAQAMECEAIMPLALANDSTRIVLAGDHMQMSPELFSNFAKERKLHISLLERLYDHYTSNFPCKILLCENYRAHEAIIKFTSELFYEQKLIASGKQPRHDRFYPLTFFTTRGEDVQDKNSTAFYNNSEVYEVVERVSELRKKWPSSWGKINDASIGIMTPYADQVFRIRSELRKRRMGGISVERVLNVQGKQFRAVFLSTVRTRRTCLPHAAGTNSGSALVNTDDADYGFLSNSKLLNTAITRAQSLVAVVGDPVALCSIGRCRKVWERFIDICDENKSLFGITWSFLRSQLDGVELKRGYVLNPLAPEFVPRSLQPEAYLREQAAMYMIASGVSGVGVGGAVNQHPVVGSNSLGGGMAASGTPHQANNQIPPLYSNHPPYGAMMGGAGPTGQQMPKPPSHHFHHNNMQQIRSTGPPLPQQQTGAQQQQLQMAQLGQFGVRPQTAHMSQAQGQPQPPPQFSQYMMWQQQQQQAAQQQQSTAAMQLLRTPGYPAQPPVPPAIQQPAVPPQQQLQQQNPNVSLWGPPPQSNPWGVLPKQNSAVNTNQHRPPQPPPPTQQQQPPPPAPLQQQLNVPNQVPVGMRASQLQNQPPNSQAQQQSPQQQQLRGGQINDLAYLKKTLYQQQPQPLHPNPVFSAGGIGYAGVGENSLGNPPNQIQMLNHRNALPNGPISPAQSLLDPFLRQGGQQQQLLGGGIQLPHLNNFLGGLGKEKEFQFLNNVHIPLNVGGTMFQAPTTGGAANAVINKQQSPTAARFQDYSALLPPNMNIYEMAFEPKESQYKWYLKLMELHGQEAANKFTEILRQVMGMMHQTKAVPSANLHLNHQHQQQPIHPGHSGATAVHGGHMQMQQPPRMMNPFVTPPTSSSMQQHLQQQQQQQQQLLAHNDETQSLDGGINFNQQIDLVFNSLMNGNEIAQPILRDLLGIVGSGTNGSTNTELMLSSSQQNKGFPVMSAATPQQHLQQKSAIFPTQLPQPAYMGNNSLLCNENLLGNNSSSSAVGIVGNVSSSMRVESVPLYRRQAMTTVGNGNSSSNYNSSNSSSSTGGQSIDSSTPDNIIDGVSIGGGILGIGIPGTGNLIDTIFNQTPNEISSTSSSYHHHHNQQQQGNNAFHKLLYNSYAFKSNPNDLDQFMRIDRASVADSHHHHQQQQQAATFPLHQQQQHLQHHGQQQQQQQHPSSNHANSHVQQLHPHMQPSSPGADNRNTTYAAVLSQGPATLSQLPQTASAVAHHSQQQHSSHHQQLHHNHQNASTAQQHHQFAAGTASGGDIHHHHHHQVEVEKDPFAAIRELGQCSNGFYNYFQ